MFPGAFYHLLASRASLADELAKKIEEQRVREEELKAELLQVAPKNMIAFIENELGLDSLFKYGMFLGKIRFHDEMCGFRDMEDTKKKVQGLQKAWKGVIKIEVRFVDYGDGRADIKFSAVL